jgi:dienelactone hydrolase
VADVVLFHHAQGLTAGCRAFADELRAAGHTVHAPDLFEGRTFARLPEAMAYVQELGFETVIARGRRTAEELPSDLVYIGLSLGVLPAQLLAQTRAGARGAVFVYSCVPPAEFGGPWPADVPLQIHLMEGDEEVLPPNPDLAAARELDATLDQAELFLYPGDRHLFADSSLPDYDEAAAALLTERVLGFLAAIR